MSDLLKRQILHHLANQGVSTDYNPWEVIKSKLEGNRLNSTSMWRSRNHMGKSVLIPRFTGGLLIFLAVILFFLAPQGQVVAKNLLRLFKNAESDILHFPLSRPPESVLSSNTPAPTQFVGVSPVPTEGPGDFLPPTPIGETEQDTTLSGITISEAEKLARFIIRVPESLPSGYQLAEVSFDKLTGQVSQIYKYSPYQAGELFVLQQQAIESADLIGLSAEIEKIIIGNVMVEVVNGSWVSLGDSIQREWVSDSSVYTFRWQQDGFIFTLQFPVGDTFSPGYLSRDDMHAVAEIVIGTRSTFPEKFNLNNLASIEEAEQTAGFQFLAPTLLPEGFVFERAIYEPENKRAIFIYRPKDTIGSMNHPSLIIYVIIKDNDTPPVTYLEKLPPEAIKQVMIGTVSGTLKVGGIALDGSYDPDSGLLVYWETDGLKITISYFDTPSHKARLESKDLIEIAESLK